MRYAKHFLLTAAMLLCSIVVSAHDLEVDGIYYNITSSTDMTVEVTYRGATYGEYSDTYVNYVEIPDKIVVNGRAYRVTGIGSYAFFRCENLTSVVIGSNVASIGSLAFYECSKLANVILGSNVERIGKSAFYYCNAITSIVIPSTVTEIMESAFTGCSSLKTVINYSNLRFEKGKESNGWIAYHADRMFNAPNGFTEGDFVFGVVSGVNTLVGYLGNAAELVLPASYNGGSYVIGNAVFSENLNLTRVTLNDNITGIGNHAFNECESLTEIEIPNSVTYINYCAFYHCYSLSKVTLSNSLETIGFDAFRNCNAITSIVIPSTVTEIGSAAFFLCSSLKTVINYSNLEFEKGEDSHGQIALYADKVVNAPNGFIDGDFVYSVKAGGYALAGYLGDATDLTLPASCKGESYVVGEKAFCNNANLTRVTIGGNVTGIESLAFSECTGLVSVTVGNNVTSIGYCAFYNCSNLASLVIGSSVTDIESRAFDYCSDLKTIYNLSGLLLTIGSEDYGRVAYYAEKIVKTPRDADFEFGVIDGVITLVAYLGNDADVMLPVNEVAYTVATGVFENRTTLTSILIPDCITGIGDRAFAGCSNLQGIEIPGSVVSIGEGVFNGCAALSYMEVAAGNTVYDSRDNCNAIIKTSNKTLIAGCQNTVIPSSVTSIGAEAFYGCTGLTGIEIPSSVTSIGASAFFGCEGLEEVRTSNLTAWCNVTFTDKTSNPLCYAKNLYLDGILVTDLVIPTGVKNIRENAFYGCTSITSVTIPSSVTYIRTGAFEDCVGLEAVYISDLAAWLNITMSYAGNPLIYAKNLYLDGMLVTDLVIPEGIRGINNYAFCGCTSITSVTIPSSVTYIRTGAFQDCVGLEAVYISDLEAWCNITFSNNVANPLYCAKNLYLYGELVEELIIPDNVEQLKDYAFQGCTSLTGVYIPGRVRNIGKGVFYNCSGIAYVEVSEANEIYDSRDICNAIVERETNTLIMGCKNTVIPSSVTSIGTGAFYGCTGLTDIEIPSSVGKVESNAFYGCMGLEAVRTNDLAAWCGIEFGGMANPLKYAGYLYLNDELVTELVIPDGVGVVRKYVFDGCLSISELTIPDCVTSIEESAFRGCTGLSTITSYIPAEALFVIDSTVFEEVDKTTCGLNVYYESMQVYAATPAWSEFHHIQPVPIFITINQYGSGTYCANKPLDFGAVEGLKAYAATGYNASTGAVTLTRVMTAKTGTGLFLKGEPGTYAVPVMKNTDDNTLNMLVGTLKSTPVNSTSDDGIYANYKLTIKTGDPAPLFYRITDGSTLSSGKAYLQVPLAWLPVEAKSIRYRFDDGESTDIEDVESAEQPAGPIYDLMGRQVTTPQRGMLYLMDGKKIIY